MYTSSTQEQLQDTVPRVYDGVAEFNALFDPVVLDGEDVDSGGLAAILAYIACDLEAYELFTSQHVQTCTEVGIAQWERMLSLPTSVESLEDRRERVLLRLATRGNHTLRSLGRALSALSSPGSWELVVDYPNYTVTLSFTAVAELWYHEVLALKDNMVPVNMEWVMEQLLAVEAWANSTITMSTITMNYRLGSWELGALPFRTDGGEAVIKLPSTPSLGLEGRQILMAELAAALIGGKARVQDDEDAWTDVTPLVLDDDTIDGVPTVTVSYEVPQDTADPIMAVEIVTVGADTLESIPVYVPNAEAVTITHYIRFVEGEGE